MSTTVALTPDEAGFLLDTVIRPGASGHNNHHFAADGAADEPMLLDLLERGLVYRTRTPYVPREWIYHVTLTGRQALDAARDAA
jgi:DNA-binding MarR family transcriptional regulator